MRLDIWIYPRQSRLLPGLVLLPLTLPLTVVPVETASAAGLSLQSGAFTDRGAIPKRYTCQGGDISPPLNWHGVPANAKSLVLIVDDPDAPDPAAPKMTWVHWVLYNLPAADGELAEATKSSTLPGSSKAARNSWQRTEYGGPCPPIGRHRYFFKLYALDSTLDGLHNPDKDAVLAAMQGHVIGQTELVGTYQK